MGSPPEQGVSAGVPAAGGGGAGRPTGLPPASSSGAAAHCEFVAAQRGRQSRCSRCQPRAWNVCSKCEGHAAKAADCSACEGSFCAASVDAVLLADAQKESLDDAKAAQRSPFEAFQDLAPDLRITVGSPTEVIAANSLSDACATVRYLRRTRKSSVCQADDNVIVHAPGIGQGHLTGFLIGVSPDIAVDAEFASTWDIS